MAKASDKAPKDDYLEEYVEVTLFKGDGYERPLFVAVNGETCLIERGKPVRVKRKFAQVIAQSDMQDAYAKELMSALQEKDKYLGDIPSAASG